MPDLVKKEKATASEEIIPKPESSPVLDGVTDRFLDGQPHYGVAIDLVSGSGQSTLMIPDVTAKEPVLITRPILIEGAKLKTFLGKKGINLPEPVARLVADAKISCAAFYYSSAVQLYMFALTFETGLIASLTGDADLATLFDVKGASVRVIKCPKASFDILQKYVAGLSAPSA